MIGWPIALSIFYVIGWITAFVLLAKSEFRKMKSWAYSISFFQLLGSVFDSDDILLMVWFWPMFGLVFGFAWSIDKLDFTLWEKQNEDRKD